MNLQCQNPDCSRYMEVEVVMKATYIFRNGTMVMKDIECSECGNPRADITERDPIDYSSINIGKISSMSRNQKTDMLKKRASAHYEKQIKPYKEHVNDQAVGEMKDFVKDMK